MRVTSYASRVRVGEGFTFKRTGLGFVVLLLAGALALTLGCQLNTQESTPDEAPLKLSNTENCLGESLKSVERYFKAEAHEEEVDAAFVCLSSSLELFSTYGRGSAQRDSFSPSELRAFLQLYFLGNLKLNDKFLAEAMLLKQSILGGEKDRITKKEIARFVEVLDVVRREAQRVRPFIGLLSQRVRQDDPSLAGGALDQALSDFAFTMEALGKLLGQSKQVYRLENFRALVNEFQGLYANRSDWQGPDWLAKQMPLIAASKAALIRPNGASIAPDEWSLVFSYIGRIYGLYLRFHYAIDGHELMRGEGLAQLEIGASEIFDMLATAIAAKPNQVVGYDMINDVLDAIGSTEMVRLPIEIKTAKGLLEPIFEKILNPVIMGTAAGAAAPVLDPRDPKSVRGYRPRQGGLTAVNLERLHNAILGWIEMQQLWEQLENQVNGGMHGAPIPAKHVRELWAKLPSHHKEQWSDIKSLFDRSIPPATRKNGSLIFSTLKDITIDRDSFTDLNWKQTLVRTLGYGYLADPVGLRMAGVTIDQFQDVFNDAWNFALDLELLDTSDVDVWKTGFTISNIFLFSSNGDDRLSYHEATDLFVSTFASSKIAARIRKDVDANCTGLAPDPSGLPMINASCWRVQFKKGYKGYFTDLPGWNTQVRSFDGGAWVGFLDHTESAIRKVENPNGPLTSTEMDRAVSIHHYIEAVFTRWDTSRNGRLSFAEAEKAFYLFEPILKKASGFSKDRDVRGLFAYLLAFGEPPDKHKFGNIMYWLWWRDNREAWIERVDADRARVMQIMSNLASEL